MPDDVAAFGELFAPALQGSRFMTSSRYRWVVLVIGTLAYATSHFARQNYTGIQKFMQADFELDRGTLGLLGAAFFYSYALFQMPWGVASDKFGSRAVTTFGILLIAATMAGFATSQSEQALFFWRAAAGIASAVAYVSVAGESRAGFLRTNAASARRRSAAWAARWARARRSSCCL